MAIRETISFINPLKNPRIIPNNRGASKIKSSGTKVKIYKGLNVISKNEQGRAKR